MLRNKSVNPSRRAFIASAALVVLAVACSTATNEPDLESLGLTMGIDIQAGSTFEVAVPVASGTTVSVASAPTGVDAAITPAAEAGTIVLTVSVDEEAPRGAYNLALRVVQDGVQYELGWPFEIVDSVGAPATHRAAAIES